MHGKPLGPLPQRRRHSTPAAATGLACRTGFRDTCAYSEMAPHLLNGSWVLSALYRRAVGEHYDTKSALIHTVVPLAADDGQKKPPR